MCGHPSACRGVAGLRIVISRHNTDSSSDVGGQCGRWQHLYSGAKLSDDKHEVN
jgi:hypothetical protein